MTSSPAILIAATTAAVLTGCGGGQEARSKQLEERLARAEQELRRERETNRRLEDALRDAGIPLPVTATTEEEQRLADKIAALELEARRLERATESRDALAGQRAMQAIGELLQEIETDGEAALPLLLAAAEAAEGRPQSTLLETYARLGGKAVVPVLTHILEDRERAPRLRFQAALSLVELDPVSAAAHVERLLDGEPEFPELYFLVFQLGESGSPATVPVLCKALAESEDPSIRCHAATALGNFPGERTADALTVAATRDDYPAVRVNALRALLRAAPKEATGIAREVLESTSDRQVRDAARSVLDTGGKGGSR